MRKHKVNKKIALTALLLIIFLIPLIYLTVIQVNKRQSLQSSAATSIICTTEVSPVCGVDGKTYSNQCVAKSKGVKVFCNNKCPCISYFRFTDASKKMFTIKLTNQSRITEARNIIKNKTNKFPTGKILKTSASYNKPWGYILDPNTVVFAEMAIEVCDSTIQYVQDHLSQVGTAFLPNNYWCPWSAKLVDEIFIK